MAGSYSFKKIKTPLDALAFWCATTLGCGLVPKAPGTAGALFSIPILFILSDSSAFTRFLFWFGMTILAVWAAKRFDQMMNTSDNQCIVIDETVGIAITAATAGDSIISLFVAFILFRFFDILKPFPVRNLDRWSKKKAKNKNDEISAWWGGFGVVADDLVAGVQGLGVLIFLQYLNLIP